MGSLKASPYCALLGVARDRAGGAMAVAQRIVVVARTVFNERRRQLAAAGLFCVYRCVAGFPVEQCAVSLGVVLVVFLFLQEGADL
jgi:hypothetical protein